MPHAAVFIFIFTSILFYSMRKAIVWPLRSPNWGWIFVLSKKVAAAPWWPQG